MTLISAFDFYVRKIAQKFFPNPSNLDLVSRKSAMQSAPIPENDIMSLKAHAFAVSRAVVDDQRQMRLAVESLEKENRTLRELVIELSATIVRRVTNSKE